MEQEQQAGDRHGQRRGRTSASVWKVIGFTAAVAAVAVGLGAVGYVAFIAIALSSWGSNK